MTVKQTSNSFDGCIADALRGNTVPLTDYLKRTLSFSPDEMEKICSVIGRLHHKKPGRPRNRMSKSERNTAMDDVVERVRRKYDQWREETGRQNISDTIKEKIITAENTHPLLQSTDWKQIHAKVGRPVHLRRLPDGTVLRRKMRTD